jgi:hypothetical protein
MTKKGSLTIAYLVAVTMLLSGCDYEPPYQRGYNEGYAAGMQAAEGDPAAAAEETPAASEETPAAEKSPLSSFMTSRHDEPKDSSEDSADEGDGEETEDPGEDTGEDTGEYQEDTGEAASEEGSSEVLGEGQSPQSGGIPEGRIIAAEAVNEALFTNPEVIDGLRQIYPDEMIFGEFVGDSETNLLHRVGSDHFNQLGYNTIVVFDGSMSLQDILNEGFFTKCDCIE